MSLRRLLQKNRNAKAARSPLENDRPPSYTSNVTIHTDGANSPNDRIRARHVSLPGRDSVLPDETESSLTNTLGVADTSVVATPRYSKRPSGYPPLPLILMILLVYYRIYAEDGAIPSKTPVASGDPFLGRIKARSVAPPHIVQNVKRSIVKVENIKDGTITSLFLTPHSQSPIGDAEKVTILNRTGPGSTPQEPLALVAKMSNPERSALESERRGGLASADTTPPGIQYRTSLQHSPTFLFITSRLLGEVYYRLYSDSYEMPSKVAIDPEEPSLGRIRADYVAPPHNPASIKLCISRVEGTPELAHADLFADISCDAPLKDGHISILRTDCPGLSPNEPMAIVQMPIVQLAESPSILDGKYLIKNRAANIYWTTKGFDLINRKVYFWPGTMEQATNTNWAQVNKHSPIIQVFRG